MVEGDPRSLKALKDKNVLMSHKKNVSHANAVDALTLLPILLASLDKTAAAHNQKTAQMTSIMSISIAMDLFSDTPK